MSYGQLGTIIFINSIIMLIIINLYACFYCRVTEKIYSWLYYQLRLYIPINPNIYLHAVHLQGTEFRAQISIITVETVLRDLAF